MANKRKEEFLNLSEPLYARKNFKSNGRNFLIGMHFDWKHNAVDNRRIRLLFQQRFLTHEGPEIDEADVVDEKVIQAHMQDAPFSIEATARGWYNVINKLGQKVFKKNIRKAEAEEAVQELNK